jgi:hypothetical protein
MTEANDTASPSGNNLSKGLTKREYFAALAKVDIDGWTAEGLSDVTGVPQPEIPSNLEWQKFWQQAEAKLKVMKADALIEQLNK